MDRLQGNPQYKLSMLWQLLDQCPIVVLQVNFNDRYLVENMSCVIHKRTR